MASVAQRFSVGINYLAATRDDAVVRADFAHIAALSIDAVRIFVRWNELQLRPDTVDAGYLDRIERMIALAADAGLRVLPALCGAIGTASFMPAWANRYDDLYGGPLLEAQLRIAHTGGRALRRSGCRHGVGYRTCVQRGARAAPRDGDIGRTRE